jgi:RNA polymerase sigma-70 factor (ECF subfamily)
MASSYLPLESESPRFPRDLGRDPSTTSEPASSPESGTAASQWPELVNRVRTGDPAGMEELYRVFSDGIRHYLRRQLGAQDLTDKVHDLWLIVIQAIQNGDLREPERLMGYVRTVVRRQVAGHIHIARQQRRNSNHLEFGAALHDARSNPENRVIRKEYNEVASRILSAMRERDRDILIRFYLKEQPAAEICREMDLTETQFRLLKSRAKARLGELCRVRLGRVPRTRAASAVRP